MYKIYCSFINKRLSNWIESNDKLVDEQNGFRKGRSTNDQISALTNIIETRQKRKLSTFAEFIDFKKSIRSCRQKYPLEPIVRDGH